MTNYLKVNRWQGNRERETIEQYHIWIYNRTKSAPSLLEQSEGIRVTFAFRVFSFEPLVTVSKIFGNRVFFFNYVCRIVMVLCNFNRFQYIRWLNCKRHQLWNLKRTIDAPVSIFVNSLMIYCFYPISFQIEEREIANVLYHYKNILEIFFSCEKWRTRSPSSNRRVCLFW